MTVDGAGLAGLGRDGRSRPAARAGERSGQAAQIESTEVFDLDRLQRIDIHATERCAPRWDRSTGALLLLPEPVVSGESGRTLGQDDKQASPLGCPRRLLQRGPEPRSRACECSFARRLSHKPPTDPVRQFVMGRPVFSRHSTSLEWDDSPLER
jgi:hypothetical protein